jgi:hypothetical protein
MAGITLEFTTVERPDPKDLSAFVSAKEFGLMHPPDLELKRCSNA